jgi:mono/diheme cytochrome c family protein
MRKNNVRMWSGLMTMAPLVAFATSVVAADASNGEQLARRWCSACHVVAPDQRGTTAEAPSFAAIAKRAEFDTRRTRRRLQGVDRQRAGALAVLSAPFGFAAAG